MQTAALATRLRQRGLISIAIVTALASFSASSQPAAEESVDTGMTRIAHVMPADHRLAGITGDAGTSTLAIVYPEASFLRLRFASVDIPDNAYVEVLNGDGSEVHRFSREEASARSGDHGYYAISLAGDTAEVRVAGAGAGSPYALRIDQVDVGLPEAFSAMAIIGADQRQRAACFKTSDADAYKRSRAVARTYSAGFVATAWRVGPDNRMLTNHHVIGNHQNPADYEIWFGYEHNDCSGNNATAPGVKVRGGQRLVGDPALDFQLFTLDDAAFRAGKVAQFGYLGLDVSPLRAGTSIYIPQHGGGQPRQIATVVDGGSRCSVTNKAGTMGHYLCDTVGGSSGSPVIDRASHRVRVLHNSAAGGHNQGNAIEHIWPRISGYFGGSVPNGS
jgi:hypothetical protein